MPWGIGAGELVRSQQKIRYGKQRVDHYVAQEQRAEKSRPSHIDQVKIGMEIAPGGAAAMHIELAAFVDHPPQRGDYLLGQAGVEGRILHPPIIVQTAATDGATRPGRS